MPHDGRVVSNFIIQALLGQEITIYGDGSQTRSFCYVDDLIDGLGPFDGITGRRRRPDQHRQPGRVIDAAARKLVLELTGSQSRIVHRPLPQDDPRQRQPDISKAKQLLGWEAVTPLRDGLKKTIAYFEALLREPGIIDVVGDGSEGRGL